MGISRRLFLVGLAAAASVEAYAAEGDFFKEKNVATIVTKH